QQREQRQAGNRVQDASDPGHRGIQPRSLTDDQAQRERQHKTEANGDAGELHVLEHAVPDVGDVAERPVPQDQRLAFSHGTPSASRAARSAVVVASSERNAAPSVSSVSTATNRPRSSTTSALWTADVNSI